MHIATSKVVVAFLFAFMQLTVGFVSMLLVLEAILEVCKPKLKVVGTIFGALWCHLGGLKGQVGTIGGHLGGSGGHFWSYLWRSWGLS